MRESLVGIYIAFNSKLVGTKRMQNYVCEVVSWLPEEMISFLTKNCWFISSMDDAWGFTFTGNDLKDQHLVFLSDDLLSQHPAQIKHSILHEIGHVMLNHRNSVLERQTKEEIETQENEAEEFVDTYWKD